MVKYWAEHLGEALGENEKGMWGIVLYMSLNYC